MNQALSAERVYLEALKQHWVAYTLGLFVMLLTSATEVLTPKLIQWCIDTITTQEVAVVPSFVWLGRQPPDAKSALQNLVMWLVVILLLGWFGRTAWRQIFARRTHDAGYELKVRMWDVLRRQPLSRFDRFPLGDLMNRATGDWNSSRFIHGLRSY